MIYFQKKTINLLSLIRNHNLIIANNSREFSEKYNSKKYESSVIRVLKSKINNHIKKLSNHEEDFLTADHSLYQLQELDDYRKKENLKPFEKIAFGRIDFHKFHHPNHELSMKIDFIKARRASKSSADVALKALQDIRNILI